MRVWLRAACLPAIVVGTLSFLAFQRFTPVAPSDFAKHAWNAHMMIKSADYQAHPLYHLCLIALSGGQPLGANVQAAILLAIATGVAAGLSAAYLASRTQLSASQLILLCIALAVAMPLPNWWKFPAIYLGQTSPNVWHNPTTIFSLPFALAAFLAGLRALDRFSVRIAAGLGALLALSLLAKPNYVLAFAPCLAVALNVASEKQAPEARIGFAGQFVRFGLAFGPPGVVLALQAMKLDVSRGSVTIQPFSEWSEMSPNIPASILVGIVFPLCVVVGYWRQLASERGLLLAWATLGVAILEFAVIKERITLPSSGNFGWGMITANHILFVASSEFLLRQPRTKWWWLSWGALGLHIIVGAAYFARGIMDPAGLVDF
jgi:hypothetical protein